MRNTAFGYHFVTKQKPEMMANSMAGNITFVIRKFTILYSVNL